VPEGAVTTQEELPVTTKGGAIAQTLMRRPVIPDEIFQAVLPLASDLASYVSGADLIVNGAQSGSTWTGVGLVSPLIRNAGVLHRFEFAQIDTRKCSFKVVRTDPFTCGSHDKAFAQQDSDFITTVGAF